MRILFVADTYYPHINGVYYFIQRLATQLQSKGHEVAVVAPSASIYFSLTKIDNISVYGLPSLSVLFYRSVRFPVPFLLKKRMDSIMTSYKPDIIHIQGHFALNRTILKINKKYNIPVIATNHFMTENLTCFLPLQKLKTKVEEWMWKGFSKVFNQAAIVTTPTETGAKLIRPKLKVSVVPVSNGIDLKRFSPGVNAKCIRKKYSIPEKPILLSVGRLDPEKHLNEVFEATALAAKSTDFCLVICGRGVEREALERQAKKLGIEENVVFTGFVSNEDLPHLYKISTCFITASIAELQSLATMEAMASGLPVVAANAGALAELVHNGKNGYLFNTGDIKAIAKSVSAIFNNNLLQKEMRKSSLAYIAKHDINETVTIYENLYKKYDSRPMKTLKVYKSSPDLQKDMI